MFLLGVGMMVMILMRRMWKQKKKMRKEGRELKVKPVPSPGERASKIAGAPPEFLRWQVELHELGRNIAAELDSKISGLQAASIVAAERSVVLNNAIEEAKSLGMDAWKPRLAATALAPQEPPANAGFTLSQKDIATAYQLDDKGKSPLFIAEELGAAVGEIEMLLSLR